MNNNNNNNNNNDNNNNNNNNNYNNNYNNNNNCYCHLPMIPLSITWKSAWDSCQHGKQITYGL